jgi:hypothetical protein
MGLFREFVRSESISFVVGGCGCGVGMSGEIMQFGDSIVGTLGHDAFPRCATAFLFGTRCDSIDCHDGAGELLYRFVRDALTLLSGGANDRLRKSRVSNVERQICRHRATIVREAAMSP